MIITLQTDYVLTVCRHELFWRTLTHLLPSFAVTLPSWQFPPDVDGLQLHGWEKIRLPQPFQPDWKEIVSILLYEEHAGK